MKHLLYLVALSYLCLTGCEKKKEVASAAAPDSVAVDTVQADNFINKDSAAGSIYIKYAHAYNNFIIDNQGYIIEKNINFVKALEGSDSNKEAAEYYKALTEQTQQSIDSLEKLGSFNGNVEFKDAAINLFKFYQEAWSEYKGLIDLKTKEEKIKAYTKVKTKFNEVHSKTEKELEDKFFQAHTHFSHEYMLHVRNTPLHEKLDSMLYLK